MFGLGAGEVVIILVLALIFIGPKKLPELARGLGKSLQEFQKAKNEFVESTDFSSSTDSEKSQRPEALASSPNNAQGDSAPVQQAVEKTAESQQK